MSVKQRGNGWQVYVTHKGKKFRQTCSAKEDATLLEAKWRHAIAIGDDGWVCGSLPWAFVALPGSF